jgi:hypothetical protein
MINTSVYNDDCTNHAQFSDAAVLDIARVRLKVTDTSLTAQATTFFWEFASLFLRDQEVHDQGLKYRPGRRIPSHA